MDDALTVALDILASALISAFAGSAAFGGAHRFCDGADPGSSIDLF
jgi:hypothetical protein